MRRFACLLGCLLLLLSLPACGEKQKEAAVSNPPEGIETKDDLPMTPLEIKKVLEQLLQAFQENSHNRDSLWRDVITMETSPGRGQHILITYIDATEERNQAFLAEIAEAGIEYRDPALVRFANSPSPDYPKGQPYDFPGYLESDRLTMCVTGYGGTVDTDFFCLEMRLENNTQQILCLKRTWYLERWMDGGWQAVAPRPIGVQDSILISIQPGKTRSEDFHPNLWVWEFGEPGQYRATILLYDYDNDDARYQVSTEFTLTEDFTIEPLAALGEDTGL